MHMGTVYSCVDYTFSIVVLSHRSSLVSLEVRTEVHFSDSELVIFK
jgi:hypothetical protein